QARQPKVLDLAGAHPDGLQDRDQQAQADRERHEYEVVQRREPELPAGERQRVEEFVHVSLLNEEGGLTKARTPLVSSATRCHSRRSCRSATGHFEFYSFCEFAASLA